MDAHSVPIVWYLLATIIFVLLNGFFVAAEFALVKVRSGRIEPLASQGHARAKTVSTMLRHLDLYLSACQLGITLASLILACRAGSSFTHRQVRVRSRSGRGQ